MPLVGRTTYRVLNGDNWFNIAEQTLGAARQAASIMAVNPNLHKLSAGIRLNVPRSPIGREIPPPRPPEENVQVTPAKPTSVPNVTWTPSLFRALDTAIQASVSPILAATYPFLGNTSLQNLPHRMQRTMNFRTGTPVAQSGQVPRSTTPRQILTPTPGAVVRNVQIAKLYSAYRVLSRGGFPHEIENWVTDSLGLSPELLSSLGYAKGNDDVWYLVAPKEEETGGGGTTEGGGGGVQPPRPPRPPKPPKPPRGGGGDDEEQPSEEPEQSPEQPQVYYYPESSSGYYYRGRGGVEPEPTLRFYPTEPTQPYQYTYPLEFTPFEPIFAPQPPMRGVSASGRIYMNAGFGAINWRI